MQIVDKPPGSYVGVCVDVHLSRETIENMHLGTSYVGMSY